MVAADPSRYALVHAVSPRDVERQRCMALSERSDDAAVRLHLRHLAEAFMVLRAEHLLRTDRLAADRCQLL